MGLVPTAEAPPTTLWPEASAERQLRADFSRERTVRRYDPRFDFHLLRFAVELAKQVVEYRQHLRHVANDQRVGTAVRQDVAARREELLHRRNQIFGLGVAEHASGGDHVRRFRLGLGQFAILFRFLLQRILGGDAQHVAVELFIEVVVLQHDVQRLVPRYIVQHDGQLNP